MPIGKILILMGLLISLSGAILLLRGKIPLLGNLPGDIYIQRRNFTLFIPLGTCLLVSLVLSLVSYFFFHFLKK